MTATDSADVRARTHRYTMLNITPGQNYAREVQRREPGEYGSSGTDSALDHAGEGYALAAELSRPDLWTGLADPGLPTHGLK